MGEARGRVRLREGPPEEGRPHPPLCHGADQLPEGGGGAEREAGGGLPLPDDIGGARRGGGPGHGHQLRHGQQGLPAASLREGTRREAGRERWTSRGGHPLAPLSPVGGRRSRRGGPAAASALTTSATSSADHRAPSSFASSPAPTSSLCFRPPRADSVPPRGRGRWVVRTETDGFYNDIFESVGGKRDGIRSRTAISWRSKSNSNSSSVVSSEDGGESVGRLRAPTVDDVALSSFASKLSPIIVPSRRRGATPSPAVVSMGERSSGSWRASTAPCPRPCLGESRLEEIQILIRPKGDGDPHGGDSGSGGSPSSAVSSIYDEISMATIRPVEAHDRVEKQVAVMPEDEEEESYGVIEIVPGGTATDPEGVGAVDEAITWAKEKFWGVRRRRRNAGCGQSSGEIEGSMEMTQSTATREENHT